MNLFLKILLYPFAILYDLVTSIRNHAYEKGYSKSILFDIFTINVGNLTVGGTGKTPQIEYLIRLLKDKFETATLSRGYGRKTKGFILANAESSATQIGDEPMQMYSKFGSEVTVAVGENRVFAVPSILSAKPNTQTILLDDAFQHRPIKSHLNILLSDYNRPFYKDFLLPLGRLRESRSGAKRADIVIVSKCPKDLNHSEMDLIKKEIKRYAKPQIAIFFTAIRYAKPLSVYRNDTELTSSDIYLLSGIANAKPLISQVSENYTLLHHNEKQDHFQYNLETLKEIKTDFEKYENKNKAILTTEKDAIKLQTASFKELLQEIPIFYLPIEVYFLENQKEFDEKVLGSLKAD